MENQKVKLSDSVVLSACAVIFLAEGGITPWDMEFLESNLEKLAENSDDPAELTALASSLLAGVVLEIERTVPAQLIWEAIGTVLGSELGLKPEAKPENAFQFMDQYGFLRGIILDVTVAASLDLDHEALFRSAKEKLSNFLMSSKLDIYDCARLALCLYLLALDGFLKRYPQLAEQDNVHSIVQATIEEEGRKSPALARLLQDLV